MNRSALRLSRIAIVLFFSVALVAGLALQAGAARSQVVLWGSDPRIIETLIEPFNASQDEYEVVFERIANYDQGIMTQIAAGNTADLVWISRPRTAQWIVRGYAQPLNAYIERDNFPIEDFLPWTIEEMSFQGKIAGIPTITDARGLYYNKQIFRESGLDPERPPATWDEIEEFNRILTRRAADGAIERTGLVPHWGHGAQSYLWVYANGGEVLSEDRRQILLDSPEGRGAFEWIQEVIEWYGYEDVAGLNSGITPWHTSGEAAMRIDLSAEWQRIVNSGTNPLDIGIRSVPPSREGLPGASLSAGFGLVMFPGANPEGAWEFIKFATEASSLMAEYALYTLPVRYSHYQYEPYRDFLATVPWVEPLFAVTEVSRPYPPNPDFDFMQTRMAQLLNGIVRGELIASQAVSEAAQDLQRSLNEWWAQLDGSR